MTGESTGRDVPPRHPGVLADLRSDTLTRPTAGMREAMLTAPVGDDVYGEDPTVNRLQEQVAALLGHEAALFTPSGSMANQLGLRAHVRPGQELLCDSVAHVARAEMGAAAALSGITMRTWSAPRGLLDVAQVEALMAPAAGPYQVSTACVVVENTHNFGGGTVQDLEQLRRVREVTAEHGVAVHLDGARLWNAHRASGVALAEYGSLADTVAVCLSKGLGAPVGSLLVGSHAVVEEARIWRKRWGGGMRQVGMLAAAGAYALEHHLNRLDEDHARARRVAVGLAAAGGAVVDPEQVHSNIMVLNVATAGWSATEFAAQAADQGVLGYAVDKDRVRYVWHLDVDDEMTDHVLAVVQQLLASR